MSDLETYLTQVKERLANVRAQATWAPIQASQADVPTLVAMIWASPCRCKGCWARLETLARDAMKEPKCSDTPQPGSVPETA